MLIAFPRPPSPTYPHLLLLARDLVESGEIAVLKVDTAVNTADVLTKHLDTERHRMLAAQLRGGAGLGVKL